MFPVITLHFLLAAFHEMDINDDGSVTQEEFIAACLSKKFYYAYT